MAQLFTAGKFQAIGDDGVVNPGALLYTYAAGGGLTPQATYTDQGGLSQNTNPVQCDTFGRADVWLGTSAYRMILKTSAGVTIWDVDNITGPSGATDALRAELEDSSFTASLDRVEAGGGTSVYTKARFMANEAIVEHAHYGFLDDSQISYTAGQPIVGHASFDDNVTFSGTTASDHHHSFQSYPHYGTAGTIGVLSSFWSQIDATAGTITEASGVKVNNPTGAGAITTMYGVLVEALTRGATNWGVYVKGVLASFFGGKVWLGNASGPQAYIEYNSNLGHVQVVPRAGFAFKIGADAGDRKIRLGDPTDDSFDAIIENTSSGNLTITPRSGYRAQVTTVLQVDAPLILPTYTVAGVPSAPTNARGLIYVSNETGGATVAFSDGTNWRRVQDRAIVS